jgi:hypothetical protein
VWHRSFGGGATTVTLDARAPPPPPPAQGCAPEAAGDWTVGSTAQRFALVAQNATARLYNVSCSTACSTSWHTASAAAVTPFAALQIEFHMQPGFQPVRDEGSFAGGCGAIEWRGGSTWCARELDPGCGGGGGGGSVRSCIRWASGRSTGNDC